MYKAMRFELAPFCVTSPKFGNCARISIRVAITLKILTLPLQKYTFSEREYPEDFKNGIENWVG